MITPSYTSLPESTLSPSAVAGKFASTSLAGLGFEYTGGDTTTTTIEDPGGWFTEVPGSTTTLDDPFGLFVNNPSVGAGAPYVDTGGNVVIPSASGGGYVAISPGGTTTPVSGSLPARGSGQTTASQQAAQYQLYNTLLQGSLNIAKLLAVQPGTVQHGGDILRQNPGLPVPGVGITGNAALGISSTTLLLLGLGVFFIISQQRRAA